MPKATPFRRHIFIVRPPSVDADVPPIRFSGKALPVEGQRLHYVDACQCGGWHLLVWPKDRPREQKKITFRCRSWRCAGECRQWKGAQDFVRCKEAIEKYDFWSHVVLTFEQPKGIKAKDLFLSGVEKWSKLRKRIVREYGKVRYIQTWEIHRSGIPHVHLAVTSPAIYESALAEPAENFARLLRSAATDCGFGPIGWIERLHDRAAMAGYLTQLSRELTGSGKDYQVPINAPRHFRRLRASVRLLPPVIKNPDISGRLILTPQ